MNRANYDAMTKAQLKQYFFKQRSAIALQAYLDKINQHSLQIVASPGYSDFDAKIQAAIRQKLENNISSDRI